MSGIPGLPIKFSDRCLASSEKAALKNRLLSAPSMAEVGLHVMQFASVLLLFFLAKLASGAVYEYNPKVVRLDGTIQRRAYPGPPNYESVRNGDARESVWLLRLSKAIELRDDRDPKSSNEAEANVRELQLIVPEGIDQRALDGAVGKRVRMSGKLTHALFGHHYTRVLLEVQQWNLLK